MSYPFEIKFNYKDVEKKFSDVAKIPYSVKGVTFIKFVYIKVSEIDADFKNPARAFAIDGGDVASIQKIIKNGNYTGWAFVPPVVNLNGKLIAGHHRYQGHKGTNQEYLWVAVCDFVDEAAEFDYNQLENQIEDTFDKKVATVDDLINSTIHGVNKGYIKLEELSERVSGYKKSDNDKRTILESVQKKLGHKIDQHKTVTRTEIFDGYEKKTSNKLDFVASISIGDNIINNSRLLEGVGSIIINGDDIKVGIKIKDTINLKQLNEERDRLQKELSPNFLYEFSKNIISVSGNTLTKTEDDKFGKVFLTFPQQYDSDDWKLDIEAQNVSS